MRACLSNQAKERQRPFQELLQYYGIERFLYRFSQSQHRDHFLLKGSLMLRVWGAPGSRPTRDIDFLGYVDNEIETLDAVVDGFVPRYSGTYLALGLVCTFLFLGLAVLSAYAGSSHSEKIKLSLAFIAFSMLGWPIVAGYLIESPEDSDPMSWSERLGVRFVCDRCGVGGGNRKHPISSRTGRASTGRHHSVQYPSPFQIPRLHSVADEGREVTGDREMS
jgi:hypothetical protein